MNVHFLLTKTTGTVRKIMGLSLFLSSVVSSFLSRTQWVLGWNHGADDPPHAHVEDRFANDEWLCHYYNIPTTSMSLYQSNPESYETGGGLFNTYWGH